MGQPEVPEHIKNYISEAYMLASQWRLPNGESSDTSSSIELKTVAVVGGGTMGRGMAIALCLAGYNTILVDQDEKALAFCKAELAVTIEREVSLKRFKKDQVDRLKSSAFKLTTDFQTLEATDLIIEAVFENMNLKKELFRKLEKICPATTIFGTNTSSLNIDEMSSVLANPSRVVGIHFFNPAHVIRMVEIVYGRNTSGTAVATAFEACAAMKKVAILVGNCPSFVFNRLLGVYINQSHKLMYQYGMFPKDIDAIVLSFGFIMGPITVGDMNGIDVNVKVKRENNHEINVMEAEMMRLNRLGRKNGNGFYHYDEKTRKKTSDPIVEEFIRKVSSNATRNIQLYSDSDVMEFLLYPMVNEGFLCLQEGMIHEESLIDIMFILGFGWPPATGGPMKWGRNRSLLRVAEKVKHWNNMEPSDRTYKLSALLVKEATDTAKL